MKTHILFFTRTGETKNLAVSLSKTLDLQTFDIKDNKKWYGPSGLIRGLWHSALNTTMKLNYDEEALNADRLIIMSPLWLGGPAPAIKTLLNQIKHDNIVLLMVSHSSALTGTLRKYKKKHPAIRATYGITHSQGNEKEVLKQLSLDMQ